MNVATQSDCSQVPLDLDGVASCGSRHRDALKSLIGTDMSASVRRSGCA